MLHIGSFFNAFSFLNHRNPVMETRPMKRVLLYSRYPESIAESCFFNTAQQSLNPETIPEDFRANGSAPALNLFQG